MFFPASERCRMRGLRMFLSVLLLILAAPAARAADGNVLPNSGFEAGADDWAITDGTSQILAEAARDGGKGLRVGTVEYNAEGSSVTSARFPVQPGQKLKLGFHARAASTCGSVYVVYNNALGKPVRTAKDGPPRSVAFTKADGQWHEYALETVAPDDAASVAIWVHTYAGTRGFADVDDITLGGIPAGTAPRAAPPPRARRTVKNIAPDELPARTVPLTVVLKFDDLKQIRGNVHGTWKRLADLLAERNIKGSFGIICDTLEDAHPAYVKWINEQRDTGRIEMWFHGWDHGVHQIDGTGYNEFNRRSYDEQKKRFDDSQRLAMAKLGFAFTTYGPPGGVGSASFDENTVRVMQDDPHMKVWLYPKPLDDAGKSLVAAGKVTVLDRVWEVNLEGAVGVPDCQRLINGLARYPDRPYFVLQGHPSMWGGDRWDEFVKIVDFLVSQNAVFVTPTECAEMVARTRN